MRRPRLLVLVTLAAALGSTVATGQGFQIDAACIVEGGELKKLDEPSAISRFVVRKSSTGEDLPCRIGETLQDGEVLIVNPGMNLKLKEEREERRQEVWLNYESGVEVQLGHAEGPLRLTGDCIVKDIVPGGEEGGGLVARFIRRIRGCGTEYYVGVRGEKDVVYVFDGQVLVQGAGGDSLSLEKGEAAEATGDGIWQVDLFEPDVARIEKWRDELEWSQLSRWGRLVRFPLRHPVLATAAVGVIGGVVTYKIGRDDSELTVRVNIP